MKVPLSKVAHTRSGDKGDTCNVGVIALTERDYPVLVREVTADRVCATFESGTFIRAILPARRAHVKSSRYILLRYR